MYIEVQEGVIWNGKNPGEAVVALPKRKENPVIGASPWRSRSVAPEESGQRPRNSLESVEQLINQVHHAPTAPIATRGTPTIRGRIHFLIVLVRGRRREPGRVRDRYCSSF
jgi:hypothetical protein